jgi:hypothetical protein
MKRDTKTSEDASEATEGKTSLDKGLGRREVLRALGVGAGLAATAPLATAAKADTESNDEKRKARYRANSPEVQTYYRVNRYPKS